MLTTYMNTMKVFSQQPKRDSELVFIEDVLSEVQHNSCSMNLMQLNRNIYFYISRRVIVKVAFRQLVDLPMADK